MAQNERKLEGTAASASHRRPTTTATTTKWTNPLLEFLVTQLPLAWVDMLTLEDLRTLADSVPAAVRPVISTKVFGSISRVQVDGHEANEWMPIAKSAVRRCQLRELIITTSEEDGCQPSLAVVPTDLEWDGLLQG